MRKFNLRGTLTPFKNMPQLMILYANLTAQIPFYSSEAINYACSSKSLWALKFKLYSN